MLPTRAAAAALALCTAGCLKTSTININAPGIHTNVCEALSRAGEMRGWTSLGASPCALLELPGQGRLRFELAPLGALRVTVIAEGRYIIEPNIGPQMALLESEARAIVILAGQGEDGVEGEHEVGTGDDVRTEDVSP